MRILFIAILLMCFSPAKTQLIVEPIIQKEKIQIARDQYGVPHIFAPTDPEVAYGLAWAHAEDDFTTIQTLILTGKGKLGTYLGKKGAPVDYVFGLLNTKATVLEQINSMDPKFLKLVKGYIMGLEAYAAANPTKVLNKQVFPIAIEDYLASTVFSVAVFCGVDRSLPKIMNGSIPHLESLKGEGSNAFAIHASKSTSGENMLVINAHQPIEGATAFYEAHLQSEEGWNILGGLFPGAPLVFHGTTPNLAWAHTVNFQDKIDIYQLETNASHPNQYKVDGEWLNLETRRIKLKIKGVPFPIYKKAYHSIYGPTAKSPDGKYFSMRLPSLMDAGALQQWYEMNRATNFTEFKKALATNHLPMFNIMYADKNDTIFYISNGKMPYRNQDTIYKWNSTLPGNTRANLWSKFKPLAALPQYLNPKAGYLYNTNHSPFMATANTENLDQQQFEKSDGYELYHNNRSRRAKDLIDELNTISYEDIKRIKFDQQLPKPILYPYGWNADSLFMLDPSKYNSIAPLIQTLNNWDHRTNIESKGAAIYNIAYYAMPQINPLGQFEKLTKKNAEKVFEFVYDYFMKHYNTIDVSLGTIQKLVRGKEEWPQAGMPDVLAAVQTQPYLPGKRKMNSGDAYIEFVRFPKDGSLPIIESINTFGASYHEGDPHFADQRAMYQAQLLKKMSMNKVEVLSNAKRIYSPQ